MPLLVVAGIVVAIAVVVWVRAQPVLGGTVVVLAVLAVVARPARRALDRRTRVASSDRRIRAALLADQAGGSGDALGFAATAGMTGRQFEERIRLLLEQDGCEDVRIVGGAGDRGADLTAISPYGDRVVVQCKRYKAGSPVRDPEMQRFLGTARLVHNAAIPLYVTTSRYTPAAVRLAREHGIVLVDGVRLEAWMGVARRRCRGSRPSSWDERGSGGAEDRPGQLGAPGRTVGGPGVRGRDETTRQLIDRHFALAPVGGDAYFAQFADDVVVEDEGKLRHGIEEVRGWRTEVPPVTCTVRDVAADGGAQVAVVEIAGEFPGSPVDLRSGFRFGADGRITELTIRP